MTYPTHLALTKLYLSAQHFNLLSSPSNIVSYKILATLVI